MKTLAKQPWFGRFLLLLGVGSFMALSFLSGLQESSTADEPQHITSGYAYWKTGRYIFDPIHPPLIRLLASSPLLTLPLYFPDRPPAWVSDDPNLFCYSFLNQNTLNSQTLLNASRWVMVLLGGLLGFWVWSWAKESIGIQGANASLMAFAFCPPLLAYSHYVTTDFGVTVFSFGALYAGWRFCKQPSFWRALLAGLGAGASVASKFTALILLPLLMALVCIEWAVSRESWQALKKRHLVLFAVLFVLGSVFVVALVYRIDQWSSLVTGLRALHFHLSHGTQCFFYGQYTDQGGWPWFLPMVFLLKTPLAFLLAAGVGVLVWGKLSPSLKRFVFIWLLFPCLLTVIVCIFSKSQFGIRRILLVYPLLCVWIGAVVRTLDIPSPRRFVLWGVLAAWYVGSALYSFPHYLAYFNEAVGGSSQGYRYLLDCNLDWGQGLKALSRYLREQGVDHIYLSYFGGGEPRDYGIRYIAVAPKGGSDPKGDLDRRIQNQKRILFAISATNREGLHYKNHDLFAWLRIRQPMALVGHSIWVYDITNDAQAHDQFARMFKIAGLAEWAQFEDRWSRSLRSSLPKQ